MKLIVYPINDNPYKIKPANQKRDWMDVANARNPYRCLPLSIANGYGWEILSPSKFVVRWNGGKLASDITITALDNSQTATSLFGEGTFTWHTGHLFKTEYPYALYVTGAPNYPKHNVIALSGIVETYWLPFTFTMNWKFTHPGEIIVEKDEPICQVFPVDITLFDYVEPEFRTLADDETFSKEYWNWNHERSNFAKKKSVGLVPGDSWQKNYTQGTYPPTGEQKCPFHRDGDQESVHKTKINVPEFVNKETTPFTTPEYHIENTKNFDQHIIETKQQKEN